jgi:formylglycine-generating enzyme required for sulfatase activity
MGSGPDEPVPDPGESPQHRVTFAKPFAVGTFSVTFDEWDFCVVDGGCSGYKPSDQGWGRGSRPVINVSWHDAKAYAEWLSKKIGKPYRLLSQAEREDVTRAGTTTRYWMGSTISTVQANHDGNESYAGSPKGEYPGRLYRSIPSSRTPGVSIGPRQCLGVDRRLLVPVSWGAV